MTQNPAETRFMTALSGAAIARNGYYRRPRILRLEPVTNALCINRVNQVPGMPKRPAIAGLLQSLHLRLPAHQKTRLNQPDMTMKIVSLCIVCVALSMAGCGDSSSGDSAGTENNPSSENNNTPSDTGGSGSETDGGDTATGSNGNTTGTTGGTDTSGTGTTTDGTTTGGTTGNTGNETSGDGGETTGGETPPDFSDANSGLSHPARQLPKGPAATPGSPFVSDIGRGQIAALAQPLAVMYEVVENHGNDFPDNCKSLEASYASCSIANIHIKDSNASLDGGNWKLYFPSIRRVLRVDSTEFNIAHINGDLNYIEPADGFTGFGTSPIKTIQVITEFSHLHESDMMPRYFLVRDGQAPELIANTDNTSDTTGFGVDISRENAKAFNGEPVPVATPITRFDKYSETSAIDVSGVIIPTPRSTNLSGGTFDIGAGLNFPAGVLTEGSAQALNSRANLIVGGGGNNVSIALDAQLPANTYNLDVTAAGISIAASDAASAFYGAQSLLSLITPGSGTIPQVNVTDSPRFDYRGMHIDVARNFHSASQLRKLIDQMAAYKMNQLHLHLTDDEGWRIEIPGLPELTNVGGKRQFALDGNGVPTESSGLLPQLGSGPFANNSGNGFYSRAEFVSLLRYAKDRFVDVIPEIDMPAHARAAVVSMRARAANMGQPGNTNIRIDDPADTSRYKTVQHYDDAIINPCVPGSYNFIQTVVVEVKSMFDEAGQTLDVWHMGGDEATNVFLGGGFEDVSAGSTIPWKGDIDQSQYDFPWEKSPACQNLITSNDAVSNLEDINNYFVVRVSEIVRDAGIPSMYAYQDILRNINASQLATQRAGVGFWEIVWDTGASNAYDWPQRGFETLIAVPDYLYFDFPQEIDPKERGYYWATRYTDTQKVFSFAPENLPQNAETTLTRDGNPFSASGSTPYTGFRGIQGQLWSETVRTAEHFDYMVFPRLLALAERAWHKAPWEIDYSPGATFDQNSSQVNRTQLASDWNRFANALGQKELSKLDASGVQYRIPTAGAKSIDGQLEINTQYPGLSVQFSTDGSNWQNYNPASKPASAQAVRAVAANGARNGRATPANP